MVYRLMPSWVFCRTAKDFYGSAPIRAFQNSILQPNAFKILQRLMACNRGTSVRPFAKAEQEPCTLAARADLVSFFLIALYPILMSQRWFLPDSIFLISLYLHHQIKRSNPFFQNQFPRRKK